MRFEAWARSKECIVEAVAAIRRISRTGS